MKKQVLSACLFLVALVSIIIMEPHLTSSMMMASQQSGLASDGEQMRAIGQAIPYALAISLCALLLLAVKRAFTAQILHLTFLACFFVFESYAGSLPEQSYNNGRLVIGMAMAMYPVICLILAALSATATRHLEPASPRG